MITAQWRKVFKDLFSNKGRTVLVVISILVGVFSVGLVINAYLTMVPDLDRDYLFVNPHAATLYVDPFGDEELAAVRHMPGVTGAEGRGSYSGRVLTINNEWKDLNITGIPDPAEMTIDFLRPRVEGESIHLGDREILIERTCAALLGYQPGDQITVELPDKRIRSLRVAGYVHDVTAPSASFTGFIWGYVNMETMGWLGGGNFYTQMLLTVSGDNKDEAHVNEIVEPVTNKLEKGGHRVYATVVFRTGEHWATSTTRTLLVFLGVMGIMSIFLSGFLVTNTISSLLAQHIRQIGVMKAVGGHTSQIMAMYIVLVLCFSFLAVLIAIPGSALANQALLVLMADMLNFHPGPLRFPLPSVIVQLFIGFAVPVSAALLPVWRGARMTVREAISNYGLAASSFGRSWFDRLLEAVQFLPRPLLLSIRNTFRKKGRLFLTVATLTLGGAIFIGVFHTQASMQVTINQMLGYFLSDINLGLGDSYPIQEVEQVAYSIPGVRRIEHWTGTNTRVLSPDKLTSTEVSLLAPPPDSDLVRPVIVEGRWILPEDEFAVVVGNHFLEKRPDVKVGDKLIIKLKDREVTFTVVGIFQMGGTVIPPFVFASHASVERLLGEVGKGQGFRILLTNSDPKLETQVMAELEKRFAEAGIRVAGMSPGSQTRAQQTSSINILVYSLLFMAVLIALVGGIGLMGTMSLNVLERTREIGVMRSIGASNLDVFNLVVVEGLLIGLISWGLGMLLSIPIGMLLNQMIGLSILRSALVFQYSTTGFVIWAVVVVILSVMASIIPAINAVRLTVRDVLAYE